MCVSCFSFTVRRERESSIHARLSLDPNTRVKLSKLEMVSFEIILDHALPAYLMQLALCVRIEHSLFHCLHTHAHTQGLRYTGYSLAPKQQQELRDRLDIDDEGRVVFAEFIDVARDMFAFSLDERMFEPGSLFSLALSPKDSIEPPIFSKRVSGSHFVTTVTTNVSHRESSEVSLSGHAC